MAYPYDTYWPEATTGAALTAGFGGMGLVGPMMSGMAPAPSTHAYAPGPTTGTMMPYSRFSGPFSPSAPFSPTLTPMGATPTTTGPMLTGMYPGGPSSTTPGTVPSGMYPGGPSSTAPGPMLPGMYPGGPSSTRPGRRERREEERMKEAATRAALTAGGIGMGLAGTAFPDAPGMAISGMGDVVTDSMAEGTGGEDSPVPPWWHTAMRPPLGDPRYGFYMGGIGAARLKGADKFGGTQNWSDERIKNYKVGAGFQLGTGLALGALQSAKSFLAGRGYQKANMEADREWREKSRTAMEDFHSPAKTEADAAREAYLSYFGGYGGGISSPFGFEVGGEIPKYPIGGLSKAVRYNAPRLWRAWDDYFESVVNKRTRIPENIEEQKIQQYVDNRMEGFHSVDPGNLGSGSYSNVYFYGGGDPIPKNRHMVGPPYIHNDNFEVIEGMGSMFMQGGQIPQYGIGGGIKTLAAFTDDLIKRYGKVTIDELSIKDIKKLWKREQKQNYREHKGTFDTQRVPYANPKYSYTPEDNRKVFMGPLPQKYSHSERGYILDAMETEDYSKFEKPKKLQPLIPINISRHGAGGQIQNYKNGGERKMTFSDTMPHYSPDYNKSQNKPTGDKKTDPSIAEKLAGMKVKGIHPDHPAYPMVNAELEKNEWFKQIDPNTGQIAIQQVAGNTHEKQNGLNGQTGEYFSLPEGTQIISDHRKIGKDYKDELKSLKLGISPNSTYASVYSKLHDRIGLSSLYEMEAKQYQKLIDTEEKIANSKTTKDKQTHEFNKGFITEKISNIETSKEELKPIATAFFDEIYNRQEMEKEKENPFAEIQGNELVLAENGGEVRIPIHYQAGEEEALWVDRQNKAKVINWLNSKGYTSLRDGMADLKSFFRNGGSVQQYPHGGSHGIGAGFATPQPPDASRIPVPGIPNMISPVNPSTGFINTTGGIMGAAPFGSAPITNNLGVSAGGTGIGAFPGAPVGPAPIVTPDDMMGIPSVPRPAGVGPAATASTTGGGGGGGGGGSSAASAASPASAAPSGHILNRNYRIRKELFNTMGAINPSKESLDYETFWKRENILPTQHEYEGGINIYDFANPGKAAEAAETANQWFFSNEERLKKYIGDEKFSWTNKKHVEAYQQAWLDRIDVEAEMYAEAEGLEKGTAEYDEYVKEFKEENQLIKDGLAGNVTLTYEGCDDIGKRRNPETGECEDIIAKEQQEGEGKIMEQDEAITKPPLSGLPPLLTEQFRMPPRPMQGHMFGMAPHRAMSPLKVSPEAQLVENNRLASLGIDTLGRMSGAQQGANAANLYAQMYDANNKAITQTNQLNLQAAMQNQQLNAQMFENQDRQRYQQLMNYDKLQLTAYDKTMNELKNYLETKSTDKINREKERIMLAVAESVSPQFTFDPFTGQIVFNPFNQPKLSQTTKPAEEAIEATMTGAAKKKTKKSDDE